MIRRGTSGLFVPDALARPSAPQPGALVTSAADPEPPVDVARVLRAWNERWFMKFSRFPQPHWDVCERWRDTDPKRERIRAGVIPPTADFDVLCYCPVGLSADEALGYIEKRLVRVGDSRDKMRHVEKEQADLEYANEALRAKRKEGFRIELEHQNSRMTSHEANLLAGATSAHTMIQGADLV